ncbi:MAG: hypothetical protein ACRD0K_20565 [Egibacteraceae bacterium]
MRIYPEPGLADLRAILHERVGIDPDDAATVLDLAAIGITNGAWRNGPVEDWHAQGRIRDGGMLRANVATTKLVHAVLETRLGGVLDTAFSDELFLAVFEALADPDRVLPDGRTLCELAGEDLDELVEHMDGALGAIAISAERRGVPFALLRAAAHGGLACSRWWGTPWWPAIVAAFIARLPAPHPRCRTAAASTTSC